MSSVSVVPPSFDRTNPGCMTIPPPGSCYSCPPGYRLEAGPTVAMPPVCVAIFSSAQPQPTPTTMAVRREGTPPWHFAVWGGLALAALGGLWWFGRNR